MPIVYNSEDQSFALENPPDEEKQAIFNIACGQITEAFGKQIADTIIRDAAELHRQNVGKVDSAVGTYEQPTIN